MRKLIFLACIIVLTIFSSAMALLSFYLLIPVVELWGIDRSPLIASVFLLGASAVLLYLITRKGGWMAKAVEGIK